MTDCLQRTSWLIIDLSLEPVVSRYARFCDQSIAVTFFECFGIVLIFCSVSESKIVRCPISSPTEIAVAVQSCLIAVMFDPGVVTIATAEFLL